jgi:mannitol-1-phosphate/altronate dehydrogenase
MGVQNGNFHRGHYKHQLRSILSSEKLRQASANVVWKGFSPSMSATVILDAATWLHDVT